MRMRNELTNIFIFGIKQIKKRQKSQCKYQVNESIDNISCINEYTISFFIMYKYHNINKSMHLLKLMIVCSDS